MPGRRRASNCRAASRGSLARGIGARAAAEVARVVPREAYAPLEEVARRRCDRDPRGWPTLATALVAGAAIRSDDGIHPVVRTGEG
jgi:hypothetical protein